MMRPLTLAELVAPLEAQLIGADREFCAVTTDSRTLTGGELFVRPAGRAF